MATVGIVGLGLLGHAAAGRLRGAGHDVVGHDVVPERNRALVAVGGRAVASVAAVAEAADPICVVLPSLAAVEEVVLGARGLAATPEPLEELAAQGRLRQIPGIGPSLEALIAEYLASGEIGTHVRLVDCGWCGGRHVHSYREVGSVRAAGCLQGFYQIRRSNDE